MLSIRGLIVAIGVMALFASNTWYPSQRLENLGGLILVSFVTWLIVEYRRKS